MEMVPILKHIFHVVALCSLIILLEIGTIYNSLGVANDIDTVKTYHWFFSLILVVTQFLVLLSLPQMVCNFLGLVLYNAFLGAIKLTNKCNSTIKSVDLPHFCLRVVTRGLYPDLVQQNVVKNFTTCIESGLTNFSIEVVTDKRLPISHPDTRIRQMVVPSSYRTSTGALFKARALQYALEPSNSLLNDGDYIVHLDEETLVTKNVINGIINFALEGRHAFGQGLVTYANQEIVNYITTLADSFRVADDMGKLRFQFNAFHRPLFGWKGSFVVTKYEAEKDVSFDHGPDGSIAEDCYFSMIAFAKGYTFDFIQGEMWEKSPFTIKDLIRQRKRWMQGIWLVVHSAKIPIVKKIILAVSLYCWMTLPFTTLNFIISRVTSFPAPLWLNLIGTFCFAVSLYMYIFGVIKSFDLRSTGICMMCIYLIGAVMTLSINIVIENVAVIWGLIGSKHNFYIVDKDVKSKVVIEV